MSVGRRGHVLFVFFWIVCFSGKKGAPRQRYTARRHGCAGKNVESIHSANSSVEDFRVLRAAAPDAHRVREDEEALAAGGSAHFAQIVQVRTPLHEVIRQEARLLAGAATGRGIAQEVETNEIHFQSHDHVPQDSHLFHVQNRFG